MKFSEKYWKISMLIVLLVNFILRLVIYWKTVLFNFYDYQSYLNAVDTIHNEGVMPLFSGNSLFAISYMGYFAKYIMGSFDLFFVFNCLLGTLTTWLIALLTISLTGKPLSGVITAIILTFYTEFIVFSTVFYTPVLMLFLFALFTFLLFYYYRSVPGKGLIIISGAILLVYTTTFFFKPELVFFPLFLLMFAFVFIRKQRILFQRSLNLVLVLFAGILLIKVSGIYKKPEGSPIANDFVFFGHTDYGGDGGEGAFIYPENKTRYDEALTLFCKAHGIGEPTIQDRNRFQRLEIKKFITHHPLKWIDLQFTKLFRTLGVVPETTSFKVLYTGLLKDRLWLTSIVVVAPVALIILMFILFFNFSAIKQLPNGSPPTAHLSPLTSHLSPLTANRTHFFYIYCLLFFYYIIATIFYGHYQERYRMPVMVVFVIPMLGYFIAVFNRKQIFNKVSLLIKGGVIVLFLVIWTFQAKRAISNKERLKNAIESVIGNR